MQDLLITNILLVAITTGSQSRIGKLPILYILSFLSNIMMMAMPKQNQVLMWRMATTNTAVPTPPRNSIHSFHVNIVAVSVVVPVL